MSLRERLQSRALPSDAFSLRVEDDTAARSALAEAVTSGTGIDAAQEAVDACYETMQLVALAPNEWEDLVTAHPPTEEQQDLSWNPTTFWPALLARCVQSDVTEDDWAEYTTKGPLSPGEVRSLMDAVMSVNHSINHRIPDGRVGKDLTGIRS